MKQNQDSYVFTFIANDNDDEWTKRFFLFKIEFHEKDINDDTQIIQKTRVRGSYDAHISSCFETETGIYLCFYAIRDTTLQIAAFMFDSYFNILGQITKEREYFNEDVFYIGRSLDYCVALEGALKLKEISYIHAEAYASGELKHGTLALIVEGVPVIALATQKSVYEKTLSNIKEVKARDAIVIGIAAEGDTELEKYLDHVIFVPDTDELLIPLLTVVPLQLLAYYAAITRGCDVDKPRNLAKSVTVE